MAALAPPAASSVQVYFHSQPRNPMEDLFPPQILDAIGGPEVMEKLELIAEVPEYASNVNLLRYTWDSEQNTRIRLIEAPKGPLVKQGRDKDGRPFLEAYVPGYEPLVFYPYSNCHNAAGFTSLGNWQVRGGNSSTSLSSGSANLAAFTKNALLLLSQIMKGEPCEDSRSDFFCH